MTFEEMNLRAARRGPLPDGLPPSERTAYLALCLIYELHGLGRLSRKDGVQLKENIARELRETQELERKYIAAETVLKVLRRSDCPTALALLREIGEGMK